MTHTGSEMGPRRTHTKSRNGCQTCKARKVKCDETKPHCANCIQHGVDLRDCVYGPRLKPSSGPRTPTSATSPPAPTPFISDTARLTVENAAPAMGMAEMALFHHYCTSTCYTISRHPVLQTVWQITVPQFGFAHQFVFRGILALAALHLAHLKPEFRAQYIAAAEFHHNIALQMVSGTLLNINEENGPSVYLFSTITCIIGCAMPRQHDDLWVDNDKVIQWLSLFRGTAAIIESVDQALRQGPLAPMFTLGGRKSSAWRARSTASHTFLINLRQLINETVDDADELKCYQDAIDDLDKSFATIAEAGPQNCETADIFIWLLQTSDGFLDLLHRKAPEALVIFGCYCVITKELEWAWWMQGFSVDLIRAIYQHLDQEHRCWLQWPMQQLGWVP